MKNNNHQFPEFIKDEIKEILIKRDMTFQDYLEEILDAKGVKKVQMGTKCLVY